MDRTSEDTKRRYWEDAPVIKEALGYGKVLYEQQG